MLDLIGKIFGNKYERDLKVLWPIADEVNASFAALQSVSNDELRGKTIEFKKQIQDYIAKEKSDIDELKQKAEAEENIDEKEKIYSSIDALEKEIKKKVEEVLNEILPHAFAVMKETARRFKENQFLEVTATRFDRDLAAKKNYVKIIGGDNLAKAQWSSTWPVTPPTSPTPSPP